MKKHEKEQEKKQEKKQIYQEWLDGAWIENLAHKYHHWRTTIVWILREQARAASHAKQEKHEIEFMATVGLHLAGMYIAREEVYEENMPRMKEQEREYGRDVARRVRRKMRQSMNHRHLDYYESMVALVRKSQRIGKFQAVYGGDGLLVDVEPVRQASIEKMPSGA